MMFKRISSFIFIIALLTFFSMSYNIVDPGGTVEQQSEITSTVINDDVQYTFLSTDVVQVKEKIQLAGIGIPTIAFATIQTDTAVHEVQFLDRLKDAFGNPLGLSALILIITAYIKKKVNSNDTFTIVISVITGLILSAAGWYLNWGMYAGAVWYYIFIYGLAAVLIANGLSTWDIIKKILESIKLKVPE